MATFIKKGERILPHLSGNVNISLGCFGCRKTMDIVPEGMLVASPFLSTRDR